MKITNKPGDYMDNVINFPAQNKNQVDREGLMLELQIAEIRVEQIKRQIAILALEMEPKE